MQLQPEPPIPIAGTYDTATGTVLLQFSRDLDPVTNDPTPWSLQLDFFSPAVLTAIRTLPDTVRLTTAGGPGSIASIRYTATPPTVWAAGGSPAVAAFSPFSLTVI